MIICTQKKKVSNLGSGSRNTDLVGAITVDAGIDKIKSQLKLSDYYIICIILTYLVIGGYQQYFWTKNNKYDL